VSAGQTLEQVIFETRPRALNEALLARAAQHPPGLIGVLTREVGTFKDFIFAFRGLVAPPQSGELGLSGSDKVTARNAGAAALLAHPQLEWLYQLDDDHAFEPTVLLDQLDVMAAQDFDVLGILYLARVAPPSYPVGAIFRRDADGRIELRDLEWADLPERGTVLERRDLCLGTSGLLVRRRVLDKLAPPHFRVGQVAAHKEYEDLEFSIRCQEAGFKVGMWLGADAPGYVGLGHVCRCTLWPQRADEGGWGIGVAMEQRIGKAAPPSIVGPHQGARELGRRIRKIPVRGGR
jgi:hypothetical protein